MGDRVSIRFTNSKGSTWSGQPDIDAPVIFCHWGGISFVEAAAKYALELVEENKELNKGGLNPLDRLEPRTVTCDFLYNIDTYYHVSYDNRHRIEGDIYMGIDENDGDNGDNGHFDIDLNDIASLEARLAEIAAFGRDDS
jgi:hypothetical protein